MRVLHVDTARTWRGGQNQKLLAASGMVAHGHVAALRGRVLEERAREAGREVTAPLDSRPLDRLRRFPRAKKRDGGDRPAGTSADVSMIGPP